MNDYLRIFEKFKDIKEISDLIDEVNKLRQYYYSRQYQKMKDHIFTLMLKYFKETLAWNTVNKDKPINNEQYYINAENFLAAQGAKKITEQNVDYKRKLTVDEVFFIEAMTKPKE